MADFKSKILVDALLTKYYSDIKKDSKLTKTLGAAKSSKGNPNLFAIVPDQIYKPRVKVCIDFNHKYADVTEDTMLTKLLGIKAEKQRIIPFETLQEIYKKIVRYNAVFFEYNKVFSSSLNISNSSYNTYMNYVSDEVFVNAFLNEFVNIFVTSVRTDRKINGIGTATISLREATQNDGFKRSTLFFDDTQPFDTQLFNPYLPVTIFVSGRIYKNYMFPIFSGFLFQINPKNSNGFKSLELHCADMLKLMEYSYENVSPSLIQLAELKKNETYNIYSTPFYGVQHLKIFKSLFKGGNITYGEDLTAEELDPSQQVTQSQESSTIKLNDLGFKFFERSDENGMLKLIENEKLQPVKLDNLDDNILFTLLDKTSYDSTQRSLIYWGDQVTPYRIFNTATQQIYSSEFSSRLQILQEMAGRVYFNFYMDVYGNACYHPYRLSNNFLEYYYISITRNKFDMIKHPFQNCLVISPEEVIDSSDIINVDNIATILVLKGISDVANTGASDLQNLYGMCVDLKNMRRYGNKRKEVQDDLANQNPAINDSSGKKIQYMDFLAKERLRHDNAEAYTRSTNIILRPELELALPIYFEDSDDVFYIQAISHSININDVATTTITCNFGRKFKSIPPDMYSYIVTSENLYKTKNSDSLSYSAVQYNYQAEIDNFYVPSTASDGAIANSEAYSIFTGFSTANTAQMQIQADKNARAAAVRKKQENAKTAAKYAKEKDYEQKYGQHDKPKTDFEKAFDGEIEVK